MRKSCNWTAKIIIPNSYFIAVLVWNDFLIILIVRVMSDTLLLLFLYIDIWAIIKDFDGCNNYHDFTQKFPWHYGRLTRKPLVHLHLNAVICSDRIYSDTADLSLCPTWPKKYNHDFTLKKYRTLNPCLRSHFKCLEAIPGFNNNFFWSEYSCQWTLADTFCFSFCERFAFLIYLKCFGRSQSVFVASKVENIESNKHSNLPF